MNSDHAMVINVTALMVQHVLVVTEVASCSRTELTSLLLKVLRCIRYDEATLLLHVVVIRFIMTGEYEQWSPMLIQIVIIIAVTVVAIHFPY